MKSINIEAQHHFASKVYGGGHDLIHVWVRVLLCETGDLEGWAPSIRALLRLQLNEDLK